jgi:hypothetical protein
MSIKVGSFPFNKQIINLIGISTEKKQEKSEDWKPLANVAALCSKSSFVPGHDNLPVMKRLVHPIMFFLP